MGQSDEPQQTEDSQGTDDDDSTELGRNDDAYTVKGFIKVLNPFSKPQ